MATEERKNITGLDDAADRKTAEYNLVESLLKAADYQTDEDNITEVEIKRKGKYLFSVHIHPVSDSDVAFARKKATVYMPNPNNKKLPPIEKDFNTSKFTSWLIYLATTEEDQEKIWGNPALMKAKDLREPWEGVGTLLSFGEKNWLSDIVYEISGMDSEGNSVDEDGNPVDVVDYAKN